MGDRVRERDRGGERGDLEPRGDGDLTERERLGDRVRSRGLGERVGDRDRSIGDGERDGMARELVARSFGIFRKL